MVISDHSAGWCHTCGDFVGEDLGRNDVGHRDLKLQFEDEMAALLLENSYSSDTPDS